jgi:protein TonB
MTRASRYVVSALAGTAAAVFMLWLMQLLVTSPSQKLPSVDSQRLVDFVRLKREEKLQLKERAPPPTPKKAAPPPRPRLDLRADSQPPSPQLDMDMNLDVPLNFGDGPWIGPHTVMQADSSFVPLSRLPPQYPYKAAQRGIEGWVRVEFDVTATGSVEHVEVIESEPPGVFDKAAIRAVSRWRFKPRRVNGKAVPGKATQVVDFKLEK